MRSIALLLLTCATASSAIAQILPPIPKAKSLANLEWVEGPLTKGTAPKNSVGQVWTATARCPGNKYPVAGGFLNQSNYTRFAIQKSQPAGNAWEIAVTNTDAKQGTYSFRAYVLCADFVP